MQESAWAKRFSSSSWWLSIKIPTLAVGVYIAACALAQLRQEHVRRASRRSRLAETGGRQDSRRIDRAHQSVRRPEHEERALAYRGRRMRRAGVRNERDEDIEAW